MNYIDFQKEKKSRFPVWSEESGGLGSGHNEWSFGNGNDTPQGTGVIVPFDCKLISLTVSHEQNATTSVMVTVNGSDVGVYCDNNNSKTAFNNLSESNYIDISEGDVINFKTVTGSSASLGSIVTAWFEH